MRGDRLMLHMSHRVKPTRRHSPCLSSLVYVVSHYYVHRRSVPCFTLGTLRKALVGWHADKLSQSLQSASRSLPAILVLHVSSVPRSVTACDRVTLHDTPTQFPPYRVVSLCVSDSWCDSMAYSSLALRDTEDRALIAWHTRAPTLE